MAENKPYLSFTYRLNAEWIEVIRLSTSFPILPHAM